MKKQTNKKILPIPPLQRGGIKEKIKKLSTKPGVYIFKDRTGRILYIGKAVNIKNRVRSHFVRGGNFFKGNLYRVIKDMETIKTASENEALILENQLIKKYKPKYNIQWRDDKSYNWVVFTDDEWPRVKIAHQTKLANSQWQMANGKIISHKPYAISHAPEPIGPFTSSRELKQVLRQLRKILPYRTCKNPYGKPCLQWHLGLCPAHNSKSLIANGQSQLNPPAPFFKKDGASPLLQGGGRGDLKNYFSSLNTLAQLLRLYAAQPIRIEAYDISNIQGTSAVGSMIVFAGDKPDKSQYRRFRVKTVSGANDTAMLREVLRRRFNHPEWPTPDLILIDGGRPQLNAVWPIANSKWQMANDHKPYAISHTPQAIISLAKQQEEIFTPYSPRSLKIKNLPLSLGLTLKAIRDEAHRFAISYYRKLHRKKIVH